MCETKKKVLLALKQMKIGAEKFRDTGNKDGLYSISSGICNNLLPTDYEFCAYEWLETYTVNFPEFSGDTDYPVKHPTKSTGAGYAETLNMWDGEYGDNRMKLLDYLIECLEKEMNNGE